MSRPPPAEEPGPSLVHRHAAWVRLTHWLNAVAFLASDEARHVTGIQLPVDLGTLIR